MHLQSSLFWEFWGAHTAVLAQAKGCDKFIINLSHINRCHILEKHNFLQIIKSDSLPAVTTPVIIKIYPATFISDEGLGSLAPNLYEFCVIL